MKGILELILAIIIIFFVWNILKRLFLNTIFKKFPGANPQNNQNPRTNADPKINQKVNWDAETVDYEEVKDSKDKAN